MNTLQTLKMAEKAYHEIRPQWDRLEKQSQKTLEKIQENLQEDSLTTSHWDELIESKTTNRLEKVQAVIGSMIEYHLEEIQKILPQVDKSMDYVPKLRQITQREIEKERAKLIEAQKNPEKISEESLQKACRKIDLLYEELTENEPSWIEKLAQYLAHAPLLAHYVACGQDALSGNPNKERQVSQKLCGFKHPYLPAT
jgi:hypothetical protein